MTNAWPKPRKKPPPRRSRLDPFKSFIDQVLRADLRAPVKQRHTNFATKPEPAARMIGRFLDAGHRLGSHQLLIRRNRTTGELAHYRCWSPAAVPLATLVRVAGSRWRVEETFYGWSTRPATL